MSLPTWDVLLSLGFIRDQNVFSDDPGGVSLDFGNFMLSAAHVLNRWFQPIVLLSGVFTTPRTISEVICEMPLEVESREQGVAWITWCLDERG